MVIKPAELPARPSMAWLRKTAKENLAAMRVVDPAARLADTQRAVARHYGFASWRQLKMHVDAINSDAARLAAAIISGEVAVVDEVLRRRPWLVDAANDPDDAVRPSDSKEMRPIHLAVANDKPDVVRVLLSHGADSSLRTRTVGSRFMTASSSPATTLPSCCLPLVWSPMCAPPCATAGTSS